MSQHLNALGACHGLVGMMLAGGWTVTAKVEKEHGGTGGHFSVCYYVKNLSGKEAFLKVLDLARALSMPGDQLKNVEDLIKVFNFERETLKTCRDYGLKRVASAITDGKLEIEGSPFGVYYIIFELAPSGDIRKEMNRINAVDFAWLLRTLHQIAVGLSQLHTKGIAHQDVKPSNVLIFGPKDAKIADLGCADIKGKGRLRRNTRCWASGNSEDRLPNRGGSSGVYSRCDNKSPY